MILFHAPTVCLLHDILMSIFSLCLLFFLHVLPFEMVLTQQAR